jgi:hypothetical protein
MWLGPSGDEPSAHGCCGEGIASQPPSCCDATVRTPDATPREGAVQLTAPSAVALALDTPLAERGASLLPPAPRVAVHGPPQSILRI